MSSFLGESLKQRVAVSTASQVFSQIIVAGLAVIALKIMTNNLGLKSYGVYATIIAFVTTFSLLTDLGLNAITGREIAKYPEQAERIISQNIGLRLFLCLVILPIIFLISYLFYPHAISQLRFGILVLSLYLFFDAFKTIILAYFTAKVRNDIAALVNGIQQLAFVLIVIIVAITHKGIYGFIVAYVASSIVGAYFAWIAVRKHLLLRPKFSLSAWKGIISISFSLGVIQVINMMYLKADSIMISVIKGTTAVGIYGVAYSLILAFLTLPGFIMSALIPSMATSTAKTMLPIVQKSYQYMAIFACLLAAGSFVIRHELVLTVSGKNFSGAATPFAILGLASAFTYLNNVFGFASVAINKHHKMIYISGVTLIFNIILNFILIPKYSYDGAAWATVTSEVLALIGVYVVFYRETKIRIKILQPTLKPLIAALLVILTVSSSHSLWSTSSHILNFSVASLLILLTYIIALFIMKGMPNEVTNITSKIKHNLVKVVSRTY